MNGLEQQPLLEVPRHVGYFRRPTLTTLTIALFFFMIAHGVLAEVSPDSLLLVACRRQFDSGDLTEHSPQCRSTQMYKHVAMRTARVNLLADVGALLIKVHIFKLSDRIGRKPVIVGGIAATVLAYAAQWLFVHTWRYVPLGAFVVPHIILRCNVLVPFAVIYLADVSTRESQNVERLCMDLAYFTALMVFLANIVGPTIANYIGGQGFEMPVQSDIDGIFRVGITLGIQGVCVAWWMLPESTTEAQRARAVVKHDAEMPTGTKARLFAWFDFMAPVKKLIGTTSHSRDMRNKYVIIGLKSTAEITMATASATQMYLEHRFGLTKGDVSVLQSISATVCVFSIIVLGPLYYNFLAPIINDVVSGNPTGAQFKFNPAHVLGLRLTYFIIALSDTIRVFSPGASGFITGLLLSGLAFIFAPSIYSFLIYLGPHENMAAILGGLGVIQSLVAIPAEFWMHLFYSITLETPWVFLTFFMSLSWFLMVLTFFLSNYKATGVDVVDEVGVGEVVETS